jgi:hypothetical protein
MTCSCRCVPDTEPKHGLVGGEASHDIRQTVGISRWPMQTNLAHIFVSSSPRVVQELGIKASLDLGKPSIRRRSPDARPYSI